MRPPAGLGSHRLHRGHEFGAGVTVRGEELLEEPRGAAVRAQVGAEPRLALRQGLHGDGRHGVHPRLPVQTFPVVLLRGLLGDHIWRGVGRVPRASLHHRGGGRLGGDTAGPTPSTHPNLGVVGREDV